MRSYLLASGLALSLLACKSDPPSGEGGSGPGLPVCGSQSDGVHVVRVSPSDGEIDTLRLPTFVVTLDQEVDCAALATKGIALVGPEGDIALGAVACAGNPTVLTFQPASRLQLVKAYTLRLEGLTDVAACQVSFVTKHKTVEVSAGTAFSLARDENGTVWSWGDVLGSTAHDGDPTVPKKVLTGKTVSAIVAGDDYALVALDTGEVYGWGQSGHGQLGTLENLLWPPSLLAFQLDPGMFIIDLAASPTHVLAVRSDGQVLAWGGNEAGQLGNGSKNPSLVPIEVPGVTHARSVVAARGASGGGSEGSWSMALIEDRSVVGWGANNSSQLTGTPPEPYEDVLVPRQVIAGDVQLISGGADVGVALLLDRTALGWGSLLQGGTGHGVCDGPPQPAALEVVGLTSPYQISVANHYGLALEADHTVWGWGNNLSGQLGDGTIGVEVQCNPNFSFENTRLTPVQAVGVTAVEQISAGPSFALLLKDDGTVLAAGSNTNGMLGLGPNGVMLDGTDLAVTFQEVPGL